MKNILTLILCTLLFTACKKDKNDAFAYYGHWEGTYSGVLNGTWKGDVAQDGKFTGTASSDMVPGIGINIDGTVSNSGYLTASFGLMGYSVNFQGQFNGNNVSGTWIADSVNMGGIWSGQRK